MIRHSKLLAIFLVLFIPSVLFAGDAYYQGASGVVGGATYPEVTFFYTYDTVGSPYWSANDCSDGDTTPTINAGENQAVTVIVGTASFEANAANEYITWDNSNDIMKGDKGAIGFWFRYNAWDAYQGIFVAGGTTDGIDLQIRAAGVLRVVYDDGVASGTSDSDNTALPSADTNYFIEIVYDNTVGDGSDYVKVYVDNVLKIDVTGLTLATYDNVIVRTGTAAVDTGIFYHDSLIFTSDPTQGSAYQHRNLTTKPSGACNG